MLRIFAHAAAGTKISTRTAAAGHRDCSGRLSNRIHSYFIETGERVDPFDALDGQDAPAQAKGR